MTDSFVTQCPHCQTSFRVSHNQLSVARGAVRCGSCLQVFNAARQLLEQSAARQNPPLAAMPVEAVLAPTPMPAPAAEPAADPSGSPRQWRSSSDVDLGNLERQHSPRNDDLSASREDPQDDALWPDAFYTAPDDDGHGHGAEPELAHDIDPPLASVVEHEPPPSAPRISDKPQPQRSEPSLRHDPMLDDLLEDPPQYVWEKPKSGWSKRLLWAALSLVAVLGLAGQYIGYHFDQLARQDEYRPWFEQLCPQLGCKVPSKVDIALIKSSNLVVRSHPDFSGALVVDAIIYNRATFAQPFPLLELRFADINGALIASRRFKPGEYLGGDLTGQAEMPPQTPIHIALDILDPGPKAVNYSLSFRSPD
ncbi:DUF3426 domain-containing protein [Pseudomonas sp. HR96]|uniref:DUF3426 domain-containing protein n=1 Tax=Pseudomonas sp. HR96 TaxID=1027966 RepID=UPI002A75B97A|nr:DUF3426 domain-containing protein [Pseudomonas sp. HR96]WPP00489.1 DUF3426 domain-containing protein [Pseudomonas sp. HR96]